VQRCDCPFTASAYALEIVRRRCESLTASTLEFVADLERECVETHKAAAAIVGEFRGVDPDLQWASDFLIFAAQHPEAFLSLRETLEAGGSFSPQPPPATPPLPPERRRPILSLVTSPAPTSSTTKLLQSTKADQG
jgi:hypothetical protein